MIKEESNYVHKVSFDLKTVEEQNNKELKKFFNKLSNFPTYFIDNEGNLKKI